LVRQAAGSTLTIALSRARRLMKSMMAGSSIGGSVSGRQTTVVTPPAAAACEPVLERLAELGAGLAEEGAQIDQARRQHEAATHRCGVRPQPSPARRPNSHRRSRRRAAAASPVRRVRSRDRRGAH
jgi:hypothetical protein